LNNFNFWQKWLFIVGIYLVVFGLYLAFFSQSTIIDYLFNSNIDPYFWGTTGLTENMLRFQGWIYGVLGAVIAGWGTLIAFWALYPFKTRKKWAWNGLVSATAVWYISDTAISLHYGIIFNAVFNTIMLFLLAAPLVFTRKYFTK